MPPEFERIKDSRFVVAFTGDGANADVLSSWDLMLSYVEEQFGCPGLEWEEMKKTLYDASGWSRCCYGLPYQYFYDFEDGSMLITRIGSPDPAK